MAASKSINQKTAAPARLSETISVHAQGRGNPSINLGDGHELLTDYIGPEELRSALEQNFAEPLSMTSADFDEDGVPDLVSGYGYNGQGIVTLLRGNVDAIYPNAPEAKQRRANGTFTDAPFLSPARVFGGPEPADFIGAGDFDADSHWDVVTASRQSAFLTLLSGDGNGGFAHVKRIPLPGAVTAMTVGEVNRRDGLNDVVVGVRNERRSQILVFEGPNGALRSSPEMFEIAAEVSSLALGQLDGHYTMDLAATAGNELIVLAGRDRKLALDASQRAAVLPSLLTNRFFASRIKSMTLGDFTGSNRTDVALLMDNGEVQVLSANEVVPKAAGGERIAAWPAVSFPSGAGVEASQIISTQVSGSAHDDLLIADVATRRLFVLTSGDSDGTAAANTAEEGTQISSTHLHLAASLDVSGPPVAVMSMRLNTDALTDLMILTNGWSKPAAVLNQPQSTYVVINTNATGPGSLQFAILDANETPGADTITFDIPGPAPYVINQPVALPIVTDPVTIDATTQPGYAGTPLVELKGDSNTNGLTITSSNCTVRGLASHGFRYGFQLEGNANNTIIEGNWVGYDLTGSPPFSVQIVVFTANNTIGGTVAAARNVLTGLRCSSNNGGNIVRGNFFNLPPDGTPASVFGFTVIESSSNNTIGGTIAGARNIMNDTLDIQRGPVMDPTSGNLVQGNFIGTNVTGTVGLAMPVIGVSIHRLAKSNTIGGTTVAARNIISGSAQHGVLIDSMDNLVQGNYIGTDVNGVADVGNGENGIIITSINQSSASGNTVGGTAGGARNVLSGNGLSGVLIQGTQAAGNSVQGNFIGTNAAGTSALPNDLNGVTLPNLLAIPSAVRWWKPEIPSRRTRATASQLVSILNPVPPASPSEIITLAQTLPEQLVSVTNAMGSL